MTKKKVDIPNSLKKGLESLAKGIGVAATELWIIFVRQYLVKGIAMLFTAILFLIVAWFLWKIWPLVTILPIGGAIALMYASIMYIGNPRYYALNDLTQKLDAFLTKMQKEDKGEVIPPSKRIGGTTGY